VLGWTKEQLQISKVFRKLEFYRNFINHHTLFTVKVHSPPQRLFSFFLAGQVSSRQKGKGGIQAGAG
jgi:hypothetical protein